VKEKQATSAVKSDISCKYSASENISSDKLTWSIGQELVLRIEGLTHQGEGVGRSEGQVIFVAGALPGELIRAQVVEVKSKLLRGQLIEVLETSEQRINPDCRYLDQCGGCNLQHAQYEEQLRLKQQIVKQALQRIGRLPADKVNQTMGMPDPWRYRNKIEVHVEAQIKKGQILLGYYQPSSHQVTEIEDCLLIPTGLRNILDDIRSGLRELLVGMESNSEFPLKHILFRKSFLTGEMAVIWVVTSASDLNWRKWISEYGPELIKRNPGIICLAENINPAPFKTLLGRTTRIIFGRSRIQEGIGDLRFLLSPTSFYQVNPIQTEALYNKVLDFAQLTGIEKVLDIYCGVGTISLFLAESAAQVIGIEVVPEAVQDARRNAQLNGISNAAFYKGTAEEWFSLLAKGAKMSRGRGKRNENKNENKNGKNELDGDTNVDTKSQVIADLKVLSKKEKLYADGGQPDVVVLNPPRGGCTSTVLDGVIRLFPKRIVYVSCNPATLARDLRILVDKSYEIREIQPVDMFPQTHHIECVVSLNRNHS